MSAALSSTFEDLVISSRFDEATALEPPPLLFVWCTDVLWALLHAAFPHHDPASLSVDGERIRRGTGPDLVPDMLLTLNLLHVSPGERSFDLFFDLSLSASQQECYRALRGDGLAPAAAREAASTLVPA